MNTAWDADAQGGSRCPAGGAGRRWFGWRRDWPPGCSEPLTGAAEAAEHDVEALEDGGLLTRGRPSMRSRLRRTRRLGLRRGLGPPGCGSSSVVSAVAKRRIVSALRRSLPRW
jgi:hypothetical protein